VATSKSAAKQRALVLAEVADRLLPEERIVAVLSFAVTPPRPKPPGKVREGIYQSYRRYRPLVVTDLRLFVIDTGRSPFPRGILAEFPIGSVTIVDVAPRWLGQQRLSLDLPEIGTVPFDLGRFELDDLALFRAAMERG
jgi:hypothetical protein